MFNTLFAATITACQMMRLVFERAFYDEVKPSDPANACAITKLRDAHSHFLGVIGRPITPMSYEAPRTVPENIRTFVEVLKVRATRTRSNHEQTTEFPAKRDKHGSD